MDDTVLNSDKDWGGLEGEVCKLKSISNLKGLLPYAIIAFETRSFQKEIKGTLVHKLDFRNFSEAWDLKGNKYEIIFSPIKQKGIGKIFKKVLPRFQIMLIPKEGYKVITDNTFKPELNGEARFLAYKPIKTWMPLDS